MLLPESDRGRRYRQHARPVRLADASPKGRMRLDAVARFFQDVAHDDATDAVLGDRTAWVVRRTRLEVHQPPIYGEKADLVTWCAGIGARWAERRTTLRGSRGGRVEGVSVQ